MQEPGPVARALLASGDPMLDRFKRKAHEVLSSERGNGFAPVRLARRAARRANDALGRPIASDEELARRRAYESVASGSGDSKPEQRVAAPVMIFHLDK